MTICKYLSYYKHESMKTCKYQFHRLHGPEWWKPRQPGQSQQRRHRRTTSPAPRLTSLHLPQQLNIHPFTTPQYLPNRLVNSQSQHLIAFSPIPARLLSHSPIRYDSNYPFGIGKLRDKTKPLSSSTAIQEQNASPGGFPVAEYRPSP